MSFTKQGLLKRMVRGPRAFYFEAWDFLTHKSHAIIPPSDDWIPLQKMIYVIGDILDDWRGIRPKHFPPLRLMTDGPQDYEHFRINGQEYLGYYNDICGLKPGEAILDVGSGMGRKTIPLTSYLGPEGRYEGFDIIEQSVVWCQKNITSAFPNFRFQHANVYNKVYNPDGLIEPLEFIFPYENEQFDLVALGSVFTHMLEDDIGHYLDEIRRVLKPGGKALISFFILVEETRANISSGKGSIKFAHTWNDYSLVESIEYPETAIAYEEAFVRKLYTDRGFPVSRILFGNWSSQKSTLGELYQDLVLAVKSDGV